MFPQPGSSTVSARGRGIAHAIAALRKTQAVLWKHGSAAAGISAALIAVVAMLTLAQHIMALANALRSQPEATDALTLEYPSASARRGSCSEFGHDCRRLATMASNDRGRAEAAST
ncbi:MAG: hypothetical protein FJ030_16450 [Chloroflexi bacterium]|nr:hypothetical protein [Chloroflexota bacterium]